MIQSIKIDAKTIAVTANKQLKILRFSSLYLTLCEGFLKRLINELPKKDGNIPFYSL